MTEPIQTRVTQRRRDDLDLVRHHYNRRALWGTDTVLYRKNHPMDWKQATGNYQNWEIDTSTLVPEDAKSDDGAPAPLLFSDDMTFSLSPRSDQIPIDDVPGDEATGIWSNPDRPLDRCQVRDGAQVVVERYRG